MIFQLKILLFISTALLLLSCNDKKTFAVEYAPAYNGDTLMNFRPYKMINGIQGEIIVAGNLSTGAEIIWFDRNGTKLSVTSIEGYSISQMIRTDDEHFLVMGRKILTGNCRIDFSDPRRSFLMKVHVRTKQQVWRKDLAIDEDRPFLSTYPNGNILIKIPTNDSTFFDEFKEGDTYRYAQEFTERFIEFNSEGQLIRDIKSKVVLTDSKKQKVTDKITSGELSFLYTPSVINDVYLVSFDPLDYKPKSSYLISRSQEYGLSGNDKTQKFLNNDLLTAAIERVSNKGCLDHFHHWKLLRIDRKGEVKWSRSIPAETQTTPLYYTITKNEEIWVAAMFDFGRLYLYKYSSQGDLLFEKDFYNTDFQILPGYFMYCSEIIETEDKSLLLSLGHVAQGIYKAPYQSTVDSIGFRFKLVKLTPQGNLK